MSSSAPSAGLEKGVKAASQVLLKPVRTNCRDKRLQQHWQKASHSELKAARPSKPVTDKLFSLYPDTEDQGYFLDRCITVKSLKNLYPTNP